MTDYLTLTEFIPGTKAKAQEVNANFSTLKNAINQKAALDGDSTQTFAVADALQSSHAVNKKLLDALSDDLTLKIAKTSEKFCVKSGNTTNGIGDLFSYNLLTITPKIGGTYANLIFADYQGARTTVTSASTISMNGKPDGTYNIFIKPDGTFYTLNNTIYRQAVRPTMLSGDVWFNTSVEPFNAIRYDGTSDIQFLDVPLGKVTIANAAISAIETFQFNQNGHDVSIQTSVPKGTNLARSIANSAMPNYSNGVNKSWNTSYQSESDGYVYAQADFGLTFYVSSDNTNWASFGLNRFDGQGFGTGSLIPISKGVYYKAVCANTRGLILVFYPCLGS